MKRLSSILLYLTLLTACNYDETVDTNVVQVQLVYPKGSTGPYEGAKVELKDASASIFISSTNAEGVAQFVVPPGIYEASCTDSYLEEHPNESYAWRYNYNGVRSRIVVSTGNQNKIDLELTMSKRRILY